MSQVAKLYLRGSIVNKTLKNLTPEQKEEIERIILKVYKDPNLSHVKAEFCNALKRTISNEYQDREVAAQDYLIALTRAAVAAKYGYSGKPPSEQAINDPLQSKKWFQTWGFSYLKQILNENKLTSILKKEQVQLPANQAALHEIRTLLLHSIRKIKNPIKRKELKNHYEEAILEQLEPKTERYTIHHWDFPIQTKYQKLRTKYLRYGIEIQITQEGIEIKQQKDELPDVQITKQTRTLVQETSFDNDNDDENRRDRLEGNLMTTTTIQPDLEKQELMNTLYQKVPDDAKPILKIYYENSRPQDYSKKYGDGPPRLIHVAKYLGKTPKETKKLISAVKLYCIALKFLE
jgi:hypothetical protein